MSQPPVFTTESDGKDFDRNVRYDPLPTDAGWHDRAVGLVKWPMRWGGYWDKPKESKEDKDAA